MLIKVANGACDVFGHITRPALMRIEGDHAKRIGIDPSDNIANHDAFIGFRFIGLDVALPSFPKSLSTM